MCVRLPAVTATSVLLPVGQIRRAVRLHQAHGARQVAPAVQGTVDDEQVVRFAGDITRVSRRGVLDCCQLPCSARLSTSDAPSGAGSPKRILRGARRDARRVFRRGEQAAANLGSDEPRGLTGTRDDTCGVGRANPLGGAEPAGPRRYRPRVPPRPAPTRARRCGARRRRTAPSTARAPAGARRPTTGRPGPRHRRFTLAAVSASTRSGSRAVPYPGSHGSTSNLTPAPAARSRSRRCGTR